MKTLLTILSIIILLTSAICSQTKYQLECEPYLLKASGETLIYQIGIREKTGNNDGYKIEQYLKSVGLSKGNPYCAAGQYWCYWVNALNKSDIPFPASGLANNVFFYAQKVGVRVPYKPEVNDLMCWNIKGKVTGHQERIIKVLQSGFVETVGFNTGNGKSGSQREGNGVLKRIRHIFNPVGLMLMNRLVGIKPKRKTLNSSGIM
jgi:hypothetical protein